MGVGLIVLIKMVLMMVRMVMEVEGLVVQLILLFSKQSRQPTQSGLISFYLKSYYVFNVIQLPSFAGLDSHTFLSLHF